MKDFKILTEKWNRYLKEENTSPDDITAAIKDGVASAAKDPKSTEKAMQVAQSSGEEPAEVLKNAQEVLRNLKSASANVMEASPRIVKIKALMDKPTKGMSDKEKAQNVGNLIKAMGGGPSLLAGIMGGMFVGLPAVGALTVGALAAVTVSYIGKSIHDNA
jgi:hypothetical protein